jgi:transposase-like protein
MQPVSYARHQFPPLLIQHAVWLYLRFTLSYRDVSPHLYRARNLVERFFNKIKQCRRIATRYDKLAANYLAFNKLASIRLWLRNYESTPWAGSASTVSRR